MPLVTRRQWLVGASGVALLAGSLREAFARERPPNVVLVLMDDLGYGDLGSQGAPDLRTPAVDRLARDGVRLTDFYASAPVCTPARAALITGRYQHRVGLEWALNEATDIKRGLAPTGSSLPRLLLAAGYATGLIGKWHLGWSSEFGPNAHGFSEFFGTLSGATDYYTHRRDDGVPDLWENTAPVEVRGYLTDLFTARAAQFIARHASRPFFLELAYTAPHFPFQPPDRPSDARRDHGTLVQKPDSADPATREDYVAMVERADGGIGEVLSELDRHGLRDNTLVIFTSDNGGEWLSRNDPFFHRKQTLWEGGIRVPCIMRWPAVLDAGRTSDQVAITMDLTALVLAAARVSPPNPLDGVDLLRTLQGKAPPVPRDLFWRIERPERRQRAARSGDWKYVSDGGQDLLFDVRRDPSERHDEAARHPEVVARLKRSVAAWERDIDASRSRR